MFSFKMLIAPTLAIAILVAPAFVTGVNSGFASALVGQDQDPQEPRERCKLCKEDCFILEDARYEHCMESLEWWQVPQRVGCWYDRHTGRQRCDPMVGCYYIGEGRCDIEQIIEDNFGG